MDGDEVAKTLCDGRRKVAREVVEEVVGCAEICVHELGAQPSFRIREQNGELGPGEPLALTEALAHLVGIRKALDRTVEQPGVLELRHEVLVGLHAPGALGDLTAQHGGLAGIRAQDCRGDVG